MKRSEIINEGRRRPLDNRVADFYSNFVLLLKEIAGNWKREVADGSVGQRFYEDLKDVRLDVSQNGSIVLRLRPVIGFDTEDEVKFYIEFFKLYKKLTNVLLSHITTHTCYQSVSKDDNPHNRPSTRESLKEWEREYKPRIHQIFMTLKILVSSMHLEKLKPEDLYRFDINGFIARDEFEIFVASMDALVHEYGMAELISTQFEKGEAHFYQYPDSDMLGAYYRYAKAVIAPRRITQPAGDNWSKVADE